MSQTSTIIVAVIVAALLGYALGRRHNRESAGTQGRLTLDTPPIVTLPKPVVPASSSPSAVADAMESMIEAFPRVEVPPPQPGTHVSIKTNITRVFKVPSKELADAVADRERAQGMSVVVTPPDATEKNWRVSSTK